MRKRYNITQRSMSILIVALLILSSVSVIFASGSCDSMCSIHEHMQKKLKSCCHNDLGNLLLRADHDCSLTDDSATEFPAVKTQITRSLSHKDINVERNLITSEFFSQFSSLRNYSTVHSNYKLAPIYLLDSVSLT